MKETFFNQPTNPQEKKTEQDAYFFVDDFQSLKKEIMNPKKRCDYDPKILEQIISLNPSERMLEEAEKENYKGDLKILKNFEEEKSGILQVYFGNYDRSFIDDRPDRGEKIKQTLDIIKSDDKSLELYPALFRYLKFSMDKLVPENELTKEMIEHIVKVGQIFSGDEMSSKSTSLWNFYFNQILKKNPEFAANCLLESLKSTQPEDDWRTKFLIIQLTDLLSAETARQKINEAIIKTTDQTEINNLEYARAFFTPNHDKIAMKSVEELYKKINFKEYGLNQAMNDEEIELLTGLTKEIKDKGQALDMGCGVGRLLLAMKQAGYDMTGYDLTEDHLKEIKKNDGTAKVFRGDWHNNAIKDQSFDAIYSLGRNILHDYSLPDQIQLFRETARILKPGGKFIFDIPDREKGGFQELAKGYGEAMAEQKERELKAHDSRHAAGGYKQAVEDYRAEMEKSGIKNYRLGTIYDSPDGINFMTRYAYSPEDIKQLAKLAGFKIVEKIEKPLPTGKGDANIYYVLEKAA